MYSYYDWLWGYPAAVTVFAPFQTKSEAHLIYLII